MVRRVPGEFLDDDAVVVGDFVAEGEFFFFSKGVRFVGKAVFGVAGVFVHADETAHTVGVETGVFGDAQVVGDVGVAGGGFDEVVDGGSVVGCVVLEGTCYC